MLVETFKEVGITTSTIFIIVIGGILFARFLTYTGLVADISDTLLALNLPPFMHLLAFALTYLILGMLINPTWLGVIAIKLAETPLITPPVGLNVYVVRSASPVPLSLEDVFAGVFPISAAGRDHAGPHNHFSRNCSTPAQSDALSAFVTASRDGSLVQI